MTQSNTHFDFVEAAARGYAFAWDKKRTLLHLAVLPIALKFISLLLVIFFELQTNFLRQGLVLLPAYFAEGWLAAQAIRLIFVSGDDLLGAPRLHESFKKKSFEESRKNLLATVILYTLIMLLSVLFMGVLAHGMSMETQQASPPNPSPIIFIIALMGMATIIWAFRFIWIYVAVALGYSMKHFAKKMKAFVISVYMIAGWLICVIPVALLAMALSQLSSEIFNGAEGQVTTGYLIVTYLVRAMIEAVLAVVTSVAMAYAIVRIIEGPEEPKKS